jgi:hypothetical protein
MRCASHPEVRSAPPKVLEPVGRHFGVPDRVVPEVMLRGPRVPAIVGRMACWPPCQRSKVCAKTVPKSRLESAMNSMLAHRKNPVCHKSC